MPYFQLENIYWEYQVSAAKTFKAFLDSNKRYSLVLPISKKSAYPNESFLQTVANAKAVNAKYFIIGYMKADNDVMVISMTMYNTNNDSVIWNDYLIARTPSDFEPILKLFAENIGTKNKVSAIGKKYSLAYYSYDELIKPDATINFGFLLSGAYTTIDRVKRKNSKGFGILASYDSKKFIIDIEGDGLIGDLEYYDKGNIIIFDIKVSGLYPLKETKNTPFIGSSISFGGVSYDYPTPNPYIYFVYENGYGTGFSMFINGGYLFNRDKNYNFRLSASFIYPFYKTETYPFHYKETQKPYRFMINAYILFHKLKTMKQNNNRQLKFYYN